MQVRPLAIVSGCRRAGRASRLPMSESGADRPTCTNHLVHVCGLSGIPHNPHHPGRGVIRERPVAPLRQQGPAA